MDLFRNAKVVRLKSHHDKFLFAEKDKESISQERNGLTRNARWSVEFVAGGHFIRLKSCYDRYLTATQHSYLLGMTGKKVHQTLPRKIDHSVEWEPLKAGSQVRLRTREGTYLRANGGVPPWRNSITHDVPHRTATQEWVLWDVEILYREVVKEEKAKPDRVDGSEVKPKPKVSPVEHVDLVSDGGSDRFRRQERQESNDPGTYLPPKPDGRLIYYHVADDLGNVEEGSSFIYKGHSVAKLTQILEDETGLEDIHICTRNPLNEKLYPIRLQLPPNNATMHIVVVPSTSRLAEDFVKV